MTIPETITATNTAAKPGALLRFAMTFDGVVTGATGVGLAALAGVLDGPFGLPAAALLGTGLFFLVYGAAVLYLGTRPAINRRGATAVVVINLVTALDSLLVAVVGVPATALGTAMLVALAVAVTALAGLQIAGLRQS